MSNEFAGTSKGLKILYFGDGACVSTGFGRVAQGILDGLYELDKYDIVQLGINYHGDPHKKPYDIFPIRTDDKYGIKRLYEVMMGVNPDILITNNDIWASTWIIKVLGKVRQFLNKPIPWICYFPIDGTPIKPSWVNFMRNSIDIPVTYTKWASDAIKAVDPNVEVPYIYHGVDTNMFNNNDSVKQQMRDQLSRELGQKINFVIGYVGRNQPRKRIPELMLAYKQFAKDRDDVLLYLHTGAIDMGWNLREVKETLHIPKKSPVLMTPNHVPSMGMSDYKLSGLYQFFDVLALPTVGEGFGLPLIEAMASGCPVVTTRCSVTPEVVGDGGMFVDPDCMTIMPDDNELIRPIPSVSHMTQIFNFLYENPTELKGLSERAVEQAKKFDGWNIDKWDEKIQEASDLIDKKQAAFSGLDFDLDLLEEIK